MIVKVIKAVQPINPTIANNSAVTFDLVNIEFIDVIIKTRLITIAGINEGSLFFFSKKFHSLLKNESSPLIFTHPNPTKESH